MVIGRSFFLSALHAYFYNTWKSICIKSYQSYEEILADPKWKANLYSLFQQYILYNSISFVASMIDAHGEAEHFEWIKGSPSLILPVPPAGGDTDSTKSTAAGVCDIAS